ncbi:hypothetical protein MKK55_06380 [Methylobacterium sp. J-059]|uniref:hypothetical protein n=1 Tax=Methylobacterium sp. J-059 TaxID=2836643 RepID=UPI001FBC03F6|nr:hypothetical protein [Methylobacterium sp. J-059]MCJ2038583.1 hypothetical protein [Methylobacterium sp. J-059]
MAAIIAAPTRAIKREGSGTGYGAVPPGEGQAPASADAAADRRAPAARHRDTGGPQPHGDDPVAPSRRSVLKGCGNAGAEASA